MDSESLKLRLAGRLWEEHGAGGVPVHLGGIDGLKVFFFLRKCLLTSLELSGCSNCLPFCLSLIILRFC